jgi:hypothetical protein
MKKETVASAVAVLVVILAALVFVLPLVFTTR